MCSELARDWQGLDICHLFPMEKASKQTKEIIRFNNYALNIEKQGYK